ncbi:MAG: hypothetical protein ACT4QD_27110 [Acidobacteriota bacterium]
MAKNKNLKPLLMAVESVLKQLGDPAALKEPLRKQVKKLASTHGDYKKLCFFAQVAPGKKPK